MRDRGGFIAGAAKAGSLIAIGIIFGGVGPEHEASLSSAHSIMRRIDRTKYRIELFGISKDGTWLGSVMLPGTAAPLDITGEWIVLCTVDPNRIERVEVRRIKR